MQKMLLCPLAGVLIFISGCQELSCCGYPTYSGQCSKGNIYTSFWVSAPASMVQKVLQDSLNVYQANGYTCTVSGGGAYSANCAVGLIRINEAKRAGNICTDPIDAYCNSGAECGP